MAELRDSADRGGQSDQGLGFEQAMPHFEMAGEVFWGLVSSALCAVDLTGPPDPGALRFTSEVKLPGKPPRLLAYNSNGPLMCYVGRQELDQETARFAHVEGLTDFITTEEAIRRGLPIQDEERVLGTWALGGHSRVRSADITSQYTELDVYVYWHRSKCTAERYARAKVTRVLPTGQVAVQKVKLRMREHYRDRGVDGPYNSAVLGRFVVGGGVESGGSKALTSLEIYEAVFHPRIPLKLLDLSEWQDAIKSPLVPHDILRLRRS